MEVPILADLLLWKKKYGSVYQIKVDGAYFYFRPLTVQEFAIFDDWPASLDPLMKEDSIIHATILIGDDVPLDPTSTARSLLAEKILYMSFPSSPEELQSKTKAMREKRDQNPHKVLVANICSLYPTISPLDLMTFTLEKLLEVGTLVEKITGKNIIGTRKNRAPDPSAINTTPDPSQLFERGKKRKHDPNQLAMAHQHDAENQLSNMIAKETGQRIPTLNEKLAAKKDKFSQEETAKSALQRQIKEFSIPT